VWLHSIIGGWLSSWWPFIVVIHWFPIIVIPVVIHSYYSPLVVWFRGKLVTIEYCDSCSLPLEDFVGCSPSPAFRCHKRTPGLGLCDCSVPRAWAVLVTPFWVVLERFSMPFSYQGWWMLRFIPFSVFRSTTFLCPRFRFIIYSISMDCGLTIPILHSCGPNPIHSDIPELDYCGVWFIPCKPYSIRHDPYILVHSHSNSDELDLHYSLRVEWLNMIPFQGPTIERLRCGGIQPDWFRFHSVWVLLFHYHQLGGVFRFFDRLS